jgi:hypothetical protein
MMIYNTALLNPVDEQYEEFKLETPLVTRKRKDKNWHSTYFYLQSPSKTLFPAPVLLAALRADPQLYSEALVVFYKINTFPLTKNSYIIFNGLNTQTLALIQRISIFLT